MQRLLLSLIFLCTFTIALGNQDTAYQYYSRGEYSQANPLLINLAESDNPQALYYLANMNLFGYGMSKHKQEGLVYMQRAAELKNLKAQMYLGAYYLNNKKDIKQALVWLRKAADQGNANAQMFTALCYLTGFGDRKNVDVAKYYIIKSAQMGIPMAQFVLAKMFLKSRHAIDKKMGRIWMLKAARKDYADAALTYGMMLYIGNKITKNREQGITWIERAIQLGNEKAKTVLKDLQSSEPINLKASLDAMPFLWVEEDAKPWPTMIALLKKANVTIVNPKRILAKDDAQTEMPTLQPLPKNAFTSPNFSLVTPDALPIHYVLTQTSRLHYIKQGLQIPAVSHALPKQMEAQKKDFQVLSRRARYGNTNTLYKLAQLYVNGLGVKKDRQKAFELFMEAAQLRHVKSEYMVGLYYLNGMVVKKNILIALKWLRQAALHGSAPAQLLLGNIYENGLVAKNSKLSIRKDRTRAKAMYSLAAQNGLGAAQYRLAQMYTSGLFNPTHNYVLQQKDLKTAYQLYLNAKKAGLKKADVYLAYFYASSQSNMKHSHAYEISKRFSEAGNQNAKLLLAILYDRGIGVRESRYDAVMLYHALAEQNNALAEFMLGTHFYLDDQHDKGAKNFLSKAAQQGIVYAQYNLAMIAKKNNSEDAFLHLLSKAARRGFDKANLLLADYYLSNQSDRAEMARATQIYNRLAMKQDPRAELRLGYLYQYPISILIIDIDYFKDYNDTYGHVEGDNCLQQVADILNKNLSRDSDLLCRYGGDEFLACLPHQNLASSLVVAEKLRQSVEKLHIPHSSNHTAESVTISIGVSSIKPSRDTQLIDLIQTADQALYTAKKTGRNSVAEAK